MNAEIDVTNIRIETSRLRLRPWKTTDLADLYEYASVPGVGEMAGWPHHKSVDKSREILEMFIRQKKTFALEWKETGKVIGSLGIEELNPDPVEGEKYGREIGYVLSKDFWGRGLMTEAVQAVADHCFHELGYDYLTCGHFVGNDRSRRVIEKTGFSYCKVFSYESMLGVVYESRVYLQFNPNK